ncbi:DNA methyltransferase [Ralstonia sp. SET104]|uniref:site-specific DNA-methyltransferase n=1 Tax=Ralstonia sp. SET104 TaxID=2448774 RepID=UPI000F56C9ED|nr:DNA methyltransferase [Ralstonia sp. SET104]GCB06760.1 methyltransferase [Ralstonia sp. SET104]
MATTTRKALPPRSGSARRHPLDISYRPPEALRADPLNARLHNPRQLRHLAESIQSFGFNVPILIDADDRVLAGHARLLAARELGLRQVPTVRLEHLSPEQARAFQIADNRLTDLSTWDERLLAEQLQELAAVDLDFSIEATGFSMGEIDLRIEGLAEADPADPADSPPELEAQSVSVVGDLWQLGEHRILCGNALGEASYRTLMAGDKATMVFSDPPYNVPIDGFVGGKGKIRHREFAMAVGEMSSGEFQAFLATVVGHMTAHSVDGALHYLCMDWRHAHELLAAAEQPYALKNLAVWVKDRAGMGSLYRSQHELIFVFKHGKGRHRNNVELGRHGRDRSNVWHYPSIVSDRKGEEGDLLALHPTVKPIRLVADALLDASARGDVVLDPFLGSGTTLMACQRVGRRCRGMELDPRYVDVVIRRWQRDTGDAAIHVGTGQTFAARERRKKPSRSQSTTDTGR